MRERGDRGLVLKGIKQISTKEMLYSTGKYSQYFKLVLNEVQSIKILNHYVRYLEQIMSVNCTSMKNAIFMTQKRSEVAQSCLTLCDPVDCTPRLLCPWDFPGKSTGVGCHFLLHGIFLTQGLNPSLPRCRQTLYRLSHQGNSRH